MSDRSLKTRPSLPRLAARRLLQQFGVHPNDRDALALDLRGYRALCIATIVLAASTVANMIIVGAVFGADSPTAVPTASPEWTS